MAGGRGAAGWRHCLPIDWPCEVLFCCVVELPAIQMAFVMMCLMWEKALLVRQ